MAFIRNIEKYFRFIKVGSFLARRQIRRGSVWITLLIITIMTLTFLSLVVIPGILVGLTEGSFEQNREHFTGDLYLTTLPDQETIVDTQDVVRVLSTIPEVESYSVRYSIGSTVEAGYITREDFTKEAESLSINAYAIDPENEEATTNISKFLIEGEMLRDDESGYVIIGSTLLAKYPPDRPVLGRYLSIVNEVMHTTILSAKNAIKLFCASLKLAPSSGASTGGTAAAPAYAVGECLIFGGQPYSESEAIWLRPASLA